MDTKYKIGDVFWAMMSNTPRRFQVNIIWICIEGIGRKVSYQAKDVMAHNFFEDGMFPTLDALLGDLANKAQKQ